MTSARTQPSDLRKAEPVSDARLLAAIDRAQRHRQYGKEGIRRRDIAEHLGFIPGGPTTRTFRPQVDTLIAAGLIERSMRCGLQCWRLTDHRRNRLAMARRTGEAVELPEAPQHRAWRQGRVIATERIDGLREQLRRELAEAQKLLDSEHGDSDRWFELAKRLSSECESVGSAIYCLREWAEPDDAHADLDRSFLSGDPRKVRRHLGPWRNG
jgi:hypothetical protein